MFKNVVVTIVLCFAVLLSSMTNAAIISSFDADTKLSVSADFEIIDFVTIFDGDSLIEFGSGAGAVSGSGDSSFGLPIGGESMLSAFADGSVTGSPGSVDAFYLSSGEFLFENTGVDVFVGSLTFDLELVASIFTDSVNEAALVFSSIVVGFEHYDDAGDYLADGVVIDEAIEFDSSFEGVGDFSDSIAYSTTSTFTLGVDESILFYFELDAAGFADTARVATVSEPSMLVILTLGLFGLVLSRSRQHS